MFAAATFDAFHCGDAEAAIAHLLLPLKIRRLVMDPRLPREVEVEKMMKVEAVRISFQPCIGLLSIQGPQNWTRIPLLAVVARNQVSRSLSDLEPDLQPHRALRKRS